MLTTIHVTTKPKGFELWIKSCYDGAVDLWLPPP